MPCSDSSSSISIKLDKEERFISFDFAKITCGREITDETGLNKFLCGKTLEEFLQLEFQEIKEALTSQTQERQFILYLEWDALRSAAAQYLGVPDKDLDVDRCRITSVDYTDDGTEIAEVILPPKALPAILPCSLGQANSN